MSYISGAPVMFVGCGQPLIFHLLQTVVVWFYIGQISYTALCGMEV
jgi:hypothetical protein